MATHQRVVQVLEPQNHRLVFLPDGQMVMHPKFEIAPTSRTNTT
ncbi:MAG: hypothetical protein WAV05_14195 [Anaerolineales bacterium]